ncbi:MAG: hypothetical protein ACRDYC_14275 [Acidimicrobiales bacterium]
MLDGDIDERDDIADDEMGRRGDRRRRTPRPGRNRWNSPIDLLDTPAAEWSNDDEDRFSKFVLSASRLKRARRPGTEETLELAITVDNEERAWSLWQQGAVDPEQQVAQLDADLSPPSGFLSRLATNSRRTPRGTQSRSRSR